MDKRDILEALTAPDGEALLAQARAVRAETKGNGVFFRGLVELSSVCDRDCLYCGMRHSNACRPASAPRSGRASVWRGWCGASKPRRGSM